MNVLWIPIIAVFAVITVIILGMVLMPKHDPVMQQVIECLDLYHDTRSDLLTDQCFNEIKVNLK